MDRSVKNSIVVGLSTFTILAMVLMPSAALFAAQGGNSNDDTFTICHATGSSTHPYTELHTSSQSTGGHFDNSGTPNSGHEDDLLFVGNVSCPTSVVTPTPVPTGTPAPTATPVPTATPTDTPAPTATPTASPTPTGTPAPTATPTATPSPTATPEPTVTPDPTSTPTPPTGGGTQYGTLVVQKVFAGDPTEDTYSAFSFTLNSDLDTFESDGTNQYVRPIGSYTVTENFKDNYTVTYGGDCNASGVVGVIANSTVTCVVTNTYKAPTGGVGGFNPEVSPTPEPTETPEILGASTQLPATGLSVMDALIISLCAGLFAAGVVLTFSSLETAELAGILKK